MMSVCINDLFFFQKCFENAKFLEMEVQVMFCLDFRCQFIASEKEFFFLGGGGGGGAVVLQAPSHKETD